MIRTQENESGGVMRRLLVSVIGLVATRIAIAMVRKFSRSRRMEHKVEELQEKFRGLDTVSS